MVVSIVVGILCAALIVPLDICFRIIPGTTQNSTLDQDLQTFRGNVGVVGAVRRASVVAANIARRASNATAQQVNVVVVRTRNSFISSTRVVDESVVALRNSLLLTTLQPQNVLNREYIYTIAGFVAGLRMEAQRIVTANGNEACRIYLLEWGFSPNLVPFFLNGAVVNGQREALQFRLVRAASTRFGVEVKVTLEILMDAFKSELEVVEERLQEKLNELEGVTSDPLKGMEIMHAFLMDLLGRDSSAAKIFFDKTLSDFSNKIVVVYWIKYIAVAFVVILLLLCLYFVMLKGYSRGVTWQKQFLLNCFMQLSLEIVFFETTIMFWSCVIVPLFVHSDVDEAFEVIMTGLHNYHETGHFDSCQYLSVAYRLAMMNSQLVESLIVLRFHSTFPSMSLSSRLSALTGRKCTSIHKRSTYATIQVPTWLQRFFLPITTFITIQASLIPMDYQKFVLSLMLPVIYTGIFYIGILCLQHVYLLVLFILIIILIVGIIIYLLRPKNITARPWQVAPVNEEDAESLGNHNSEGSGTSIRNTTREMLQQSFAYVPSITSEDEEQTAAYAAIREVLRVYDIENQNSSSNISEAVVVERSNNRKSKFDIMEWEPIITTFENVDEDYPMDERDLFL